MNMINMQGRKHNVNDRCTLAVLMPPLNQDIMPPMKNNLNNLEIAASWEQNHACFPVKDLGLLVEMLRRM